MLLEIKKNGTKRNERAIARQQTPEQYHEELLSTKNRLFICFVCTHRFGNCETGSRQSNKSLPIFISRRSCIVHTTKRWTVFTNRIIFISICFFFVFFRFLGPKRKGTTHSHAQTESFSLFWYAYPNSDDIQIYNNIILFVVPDYNLIQHVGADGVFWKMCLVVGIGLWEKETWPYDTAAHAFSFWYLSHSSVDADEHLKWP